jgi:hypothetical protein
VAVGEVRTESNGGSVMVTKFETDAATASVTVTQYSPAQRAPTVDVTSAPGVVHRYSYGCVPPVAKASAPPSQAKEQVTFVVLKFTASCACVSKMLRDARDRKTKSFFMVGIRIVRPNVSSQLFELSSSQLIFFVPFCTEKIS